jgi:hypothetical protein
MIRAGLVLLTFFVGVGALMGAAFLFGGNWLPAEVVYLWAAATVVMALAGLVFLVRGRFGWLGEGEVTGLPTRLIGVALLLPGAVFLTYWGLALLEPERGGERFLAGALLSLALASVCPLLAWTGAIIATWSSGRGAVGR